MSKIFDKQIHKDDFRLRILVTNGCNKQCKNCLNDFQSKPINKIDFLDPIIAKDIIKPYCLFMGSKSQVEISGGEPGIYPHLKEVVSYAKGFNSFVKVNTNGTALNRGIDEFVDCWHIGVTGIQSDLVENIIKVNGQIQLVVTYDKIEEVEYIVRYYSFYNIPIKLFVDFFSEGKEKEEIEKKIVTIINTYPNFNIKTRYTGVQENRGILCSGCNKKCITLKALWVFPSGKVSPCPQGIIKPQSFSNIEDVFNGHLKKQTKGEKE